MKVLLVDDDPFVLELLHHQLNHLSIGDVSSCEDAARALDLINGAHDDYDLLFCDLNMPGMDGVEFVRHLAERRYGGGVVLISGEDPRTLATVSNVLEVAPLGEDQPSIGDEPDHAHYADHHQRDHHEYLTFVITEPADELHCAATSRLR